MREHELRAALAAHERDVIAAVDLAALATPALADLFRRIAEAFPPLGDRIRAVLEARLAGAASAHELTGPPFFLPRALDLALYTALAELTEAQRTSLIRPVGETMLRDLIENPGLGSAGDEPEMVPGEGGFRPKMLEESVFRPPIMFDRPPLASANGGDDHATANGGNGDGAPIPRNGGGHPASANGGGEQPAGRLRRPRSRRVVSTGFAGADRPTEPLAARLPLRPAGQHVFWLEVGEPVKGSIEEKHVELVPDETLEEGAEFVVALFGFPGELEIDERRSTGELRYRADGRFVVARQPGHDRRPTADPYVSAAEHRLFFPITTPPRSGRARLRCNIYFRGVVVQSRLVTTFVGAVPAGRRGQTARVDFQLAHLDAPHELAPIQPHALSLQLNANGTAARSFRFASFVAGQDEFKSDAVLPATELQDLITQGRGAMRRAAWGSTAAWTTGTKFNYAAPPHPDMTSDLLELMRKGRQLYSAIINELAGGPDGATALRKRMLAPGRVQVVNAGSPSELIPTSLVYDYPNTDPALGGMSLCPAFVASRGPDTPLEETACFKGACPSIAVPQVVCPSGFWGYRHAIGVPVNSKWGPAPPLRLKFAGTPSLGMAVFPGFDLVDEHRDRIAGHDPGWTLLPPADTYEEAIELLKARPHVVYFYCHGGVSSGNVPYLQVGTDKTRVISNQSLMWDDEDRYRLPRSLVILNGCETNALEPNRAMKLVSSFVDNVAAAGVIGSEITISEELAVAFGEALLSNIRQSVEVGEAVRRARLALLKQGNPLGLVYLPLVAADATLEPVN